MQCITGGGGGSGCVESIYCTGVIQCVFDQIQNLQNCFTAPNKNLGRGGGPQTDKHLPPRPLTGQVLIADI